jgi:hypothetical protein
VSVTEQFDVPINETRPNELLDGAAGGLGA